MKMSYDYRNFKYDDTYFSCLFCYSSISEPTVYYISTKNLIKTTK